MSKRKNRTTRQREIILSALHDHDGHIDVYSLYLKAKKKKRRLSLSTVYRALAGFVEQGLVRKLTFDGVGRFYEMAKPIEHHHMLCLGCGGIVELSPVLGKDEERLLKQTDIEIVAVEVTLKGYCPSCVSDERRDNMT